MIARLTSMQTLGATTPFQTKHVNSNALRWLQGIRTLITRAVLVLVLLVSCGCGEARHEHFTSYAQLMKAGAGSRSWFPKCTPPSAFELENRHDLDSNQVAGSFNLPAGQSNFLECGLPLPFSEIKLDPDIPNWPQCLTGKVTSATVKSCGMRAGVEDLFVVIVDPRTDRVFFWSR